MKKLLNISVIAALAVLPMAANAEAGDPTGLAQNEEASLAAMDAPYGLVGSDATDSNLATAGYVKGAYNSAMMAINKVANTADDAAEAIETKLTTGGANGYEISAKTVTTTGNVTVGGNETVAGTLGVTGKATLGSAEVTGATTLTGDATVNNITVSSGKSLSTQGATIAAGTGTTVTGTLNAGGATVAGTAQNNVAVQYATLTNATIDADDNTITDLTSNNLKAGEMIKASVTENNVTTGGIAAYATASDTKFVSEKAVAEAIKNINTDSTVTSGNFIVNTNSVAENLEALDAGIGDLSDFNDATDGNHYATTTTDVAGNLTQLDTAVYNIDTTVIPVMTTWGNTTATNRTIAGYRAAM